MAAKNVAGDYDKRIRRAEHLVSVHPFAQEILTFYIRVAEFQKSLYARVLATPRGDAKETSSLLKDAEIQAAVTDSTATVLDEAVNPSPQGGSSTTLIYAVGVFSGLLVGVIVAFMRD